MVTYRYLICYCTIIDAHQELEEAAETESSKTNSNSPSVSQNESEFNTLLNGKYVQTKFDSHSTFIFSVTFYVFYD